jgi:hypothetical protein
VFRKHGRWFWLAVALLVAVCVFYFPSLVAYRYTADAQNAGFLSHPWRSWSFIYTALAVPGDAKLKTSGTAFRKAEELLDGTGVTVQQVRLLFLPAGKRYSFTQGLSGRRLTVTIVPRYRFVWEVDGTVTDVTGRQQLVVLLLDYRSGAVLYNVLDDMPGHERPPSPLPGPGPYAATPATPAPGAAR